MSLSRFAPGLQKALDLAGNTHTLYDVVEQIQRGDAQLWTQDEALIVTEVLQYPQRKAVRFWLATGELLDCIRLSRQIVKWAKNEGCSLAIIEGRRGWVRALRDEEGWTEKMTVLTREL